MTEKMEAFAELLRSAEAAASSFDGNKLSRASEELELYVESLLAQSLSQEEFEHVRVALIAYRDLCGFLQDTLHGALLRAAGAHQAVGYGQMAQDMHVPTHLQPLLRRYA